MKAKDLKVIQGVFHKKYGLDAYFVDYVTQDTVYVSIVECRKQYPYSMLRVTDKRKEIPLSEFKEYYYSGFYTRSMINN